jgi:hypothetical protein
LCLLSGWYSRRRRASNQKTLKHWAPGTPWINCQPLTSNGKYDPTVLVIFLSLHSILTKRLERGSNFYQTETGATNSSTRTRLFSFSVSQYMVVKTLREEWQTEEWKCSHAIKRNLGMKIRIATRKTASTVTYHFDGHSTVHIDKSIGQISYNIFGCPR